MGTMRFDETWWIKGHGTFGAHEEGGLLRAHAPLSERLSIIIKKKLNL